MGLLPDTSDNTGILSVLIKPVRRVTLADGTVFIPQVTIEEDKVDEFVITRHAVERGADITDNIYGQPPAITMRWGFTDYGVPSLSGLANTLSQGVPLSLPSTIRAIYAKILGWANNPQLATIVTGKRTYKNMVLASIRETGDRKTENALIITMRWQTILIADTQSVAVPPRANQAQPNVTGAVDNAGAKQLQPAATASNGGVSGSLLPAVGGATPSNTTTTVSSATVVST